MKEILVTSSALILVLLLLRRLFRNSVPRRAQYALWGLVLLRLLVPVSLPAADFSLLTAMEPLSGNIESLYAAPVSQSTRSLNGEWVYGPPEVPFLAVGPATGDNTQTFPGRDHTGTPVESQVEYRQQFDLNALLRPVWYGGMALMTCWLLLSNLRFWRKLRQNRRYFSIEGCKRPVYLVEEGLPSPCLFGLFRPAVYLTPAAVRSPDTLRHVLAHEETHARHLDPLWSLLRGICLAVYWFDPLVWWAALASRTDCELACDEGALRRLGEEQRIPYGQTLLSLIPVAKGPENPLLSATTMTAGKRQLRDRITRIAENRRTVGTALFAAAALAALACAVTFTGAKTAAVPMTEAEIEWFNLQFFNGDSFNIRNQFLSSSYEHPEDIDLFALFYCGQSAEVTEAERQAAAQAMGGFDPEVDLTRYSTEEMDMILEENAGLTLGETSGLHLDEFTYLPEYDAYYHFHGDTNYRASVSIVSGEREGDLARLHYVDDFYADGWKCVTLQQTAEGNWQFVSNLPWDAPIEYPAAQLTIPLDGLEPYEPLPVERLPFPDVKTSMLNVTGPSLAETALFPYLLMFFQDDGGFCYAGVQHGAMSAWPQPFLKMSGGSIDSGMFQDVLGHDGFTISYTSLEGESLTDYYYLTEDGIPVLLARCGRDVRELDLNGDGEKELVSCPGSGAQIVFQRDGKLYAADIRAILEENWAVSDLTFSGWDPAGRCLTLSARNAYAHLDSTSRHLEDADMTLFRTLYFDGENLLLCADPRTPENHIMGAYDAPAGVVSVAQEFAAGVLEQKQMEDGPSYDGWRIGTLTGPFTETVNGQEYEIWQMDYELHTTTPDLVFLAGSAYMDENGWCGSYRPSYLFFRRGGDSAREYLYAVAESDVAPGSAFFQANMIEQLISVGELEYDELDGEDLYSIFRNRPDQLMEALGTLLPADRRDAALEKLAVCLKGDESAWNAALDFMRTAQLTRGGPEAWERLQKLVSAVPNAAGDVQAALTEIMAGEKVAMLMNAPGGSVNNRYYEIAPDEGNGPNREKYLTASFDWSCAEKETFSYSLCLRVSSEDGNLRLLFWDTSDLVCLYRNGEETWFRAVPRSDEVVEENIFDFMRTWYDEAEMEHLRGEVLVVRDRGQSRQEIAETWVNDYTQASLLVTPGSKFEYSYDQVVVQVSEDGEIPDAVFPEWTEGKERFHFSYEEIFVLGNEKPGTLAWNWAGNTGTYEGDGAPEGALSCYRTGFMYKTEEGWRCDAVGTGP